MIQKRVTTFVTLLCLAACGEAPVPTFARGQSDDSEAVSLLGKRLSLEDLDKMQFKPSGARVALQSYFSYASPVVTFSIPKQSNFVEILRCDDSLKVLGTIDTVDVRTLDVGYAYDEQAAMLKRNDFWAAAVAAGCQRITTGLADENFYDTEAPDGSSFYILHACVLGERIINLEQSSPADVAPQCSRMVATTSVLRYANERAAAQKQKLADAQKLADKAFGLTRQAMSVAVKLNSEITACQTESAARAQKKSIFDWLGQGLGFAKLLFPLFNVAFDVTKIEDGLAQLKNVFGIQQPNLPASCQFAIRLQDQGKLLATEIEALQKQYMALFSQLNSPTLNLEDMRDENQSNVSTF